MINHAVKTLDRAKNSWAIFCKYFFGLHLMMHLVGHGLLENKHTNLYRFIANINKKSSRLRRAAIFPIFTSWKSTVNDKAQRIVSVAALSNLSVKIHPNSCAACWRSKAYYRVQCVFLRPRRGTISLHRLHDQAHQNLTNKWPFSEIFEHGVSCSS